MRLSRRKISLPYGIKTTKEGVRFIIALVLIGFASFNTGNNLIYLVFSLMLSILLISIAALWINFQGLSIRISTTEPIFARKPARMLITINNSKKHIPSYSVRVTVGINEPCYISHMPPGETGNIPVPVTYPKRGVYSYGSVQFESGFPFIFFTRTVSAEVKGEVLVYPEIFEELELESFTGKAAGDTITTRPGYGEELLRIRAFQGGDDPRKMHWKATAKTGVLMVKEFAEETPRTASIYLDQSGDRNDELFEKAVSLAASAAWKLGAAGFHVRLVLCVSCVPFGYGLEHVYRILGKLAEAGEASGQPCQERESVDGLAVVILKSASSPMSAKVSESDKVIYADMV